MKRESIKREPFAERGAKGERGGSRRLRQLLSIMLTLIMVAAFSGPGTFRAYAVTGSQIAADGVYQSQLTVSKYKTGKLDKTYTGTLNVAVIDGEISGLWVTNASDDKMSKLITTEVYYSYVGQEASQSAAAGVDTVSSASLSTDSSGSSYSNAKKYYTSNLKEAVQNALAKAPAAQGSGDSQQDAVTTVTGTALVSDSEGSKIVLKVGLDKDGRIVSLEAADDSIGSWESILSKNAGSYTGKTADEIDAVSGATKYTTAVNEAVLNALKNITPAAPKIIEGDGASWEKGSSKGLTFRSDADFSIFSKKVTVDGKAISANNYSAKSGSTVVTLDKDYLETLNAGSHSIGIVSETGTASGTFSVTEPAGSGSGSGSGTSSGPYTGTIVNTLTDGDYIIADRYNNYSNYYALGNDTAGTSGGGYGYAGVDVTIDGNQATVEDAAGVWTWDSSSKSFYNAKAGKYLALPSSSWSAGNFFSSSPVELNFYSVSGNEATVYVPNGNGGYYLNAAYPSNGKAFSSLKANYINSANLSSGSGVYFYKIDAAQEQKATIELSKSGVTLELGADTEVTADLTGCGNLSYTSSNADVAEVSIDGDKITVTGKTAGTAVLTFSAEPSSGYTAPNTVTLTVTVNSGGTGGGGSGQTTTTTPGDPKYVKSIAPEDKVADNYTISLNVTADDLESVTTTPGTSGQKGTNLVMVIDVSGSIVGKEDALNSAIQSLAQGLPDNSQVGVVAFNESASQSNVFTKSNISGLSFSGVENAATNMATGISAATSLLNGSGWADSSNRKAMVIISDFDIDDYANSINNAKTAKSAGTTVYSVKIDSTSVGAASMTELTSDNKAGSIPAATRYISSQYPGASAVNNSMFGLFNQATVTPGTADNSAAYVYGAGGGNWSEIFAEIKATEGITEESSVPMKNVIIADELSEYVDFAQTDNNYGVTLDIDPAEAADKPSDAKVSIKSVTVDGRKIAVSLAGELTDGSTYTVNIPVKPSAKAQEEADQSPDAVKSFVSNVEAKMTYRYDDENKGEVTYKEVPKILVAKQVKLTYDANAGEDEVTGMPDPLTTEPAAVATSGENEGFAAFAVTDAAPTRTGCTFLGWAEDKAATEAQYKKGDKVLIDEDTTLYAVWKTKAVTITFDGNGGTDTEDPQKMDPQTGDYGSDIKLKKNAFAKAGYKFAGWKVIKAEDPPNRLQQFFSAKARAKASVGETYEDEATLEGVTQDITLQAQWTPIEYKITYDLDGGSTSSENPGTYTVESDDITLTNPEKEGFTFQGWTGTDLDAATDAVTIQKGSTGDRSYQAVWEEKEEPPEPPTPPAPTEKKYTVETESTHVYEIFQILTGDYAQLDGKDVLTNTEVGQNGKLPAGTTLEQALADLEAVADEDANTDKQQLAVIEKYVDLTGDPVKTVTDGQAAEGLPGGYYLIRDKENWNGKYHASTTYITLIVKNQKFTPKSLRPSVDKQVADDEGVKDSTASTDPTNLDPDTTWGESADHAINESFQFRLTAAIPASEHMKDYGAYKIKFTDTMSEGVDFEKIDSVTIDGTKIDKGKYSLSDTSESTWTLTIDDVKTAAQNLNIDDGATIVVTYSAHLNEKAVVHNESAKGATNRNSVYLEYSNNPNTGHAEEMGKTTEDHVWVYTYKVSNVKYADEAKAGKELAGAKFTISAGGNVLKLKDNGNGTYTVADQGSSSGTVTEMVSASNGQFDIIGLDAGTYTLTETEAPGGYNKGADVTLKIDAAHSETDDTAQANLVLSQDSTMGTEIINQSGAELPSTGGAGTTMIYIMGLLLIAVSGSLLVVRSRRRAEN